MSCDDVDIEDSGRAVQATREERAPTVLPRRRRQEGADAAERKVAEAQGVPGTQTLWIRTFGCAHNSSDSEYMEGLLTSHGFTFTDNPDAAALWLVNSCTVKDPSQAAMETVIRKAQAAERPIVVAGCVPQADRHLKSLGGVSMIGTQQIDRVVEVVEATLAGAQVRLLGRARLPRLDLPKVRKNPRVEIVPLSTGCLGSCTYCKTRHARGKLGSYAPEAIIDRAISALEEEGGAVREIWLSSEDTGAYGIDLGTSLGALLRRLLPAVAERCPTAMVRLGMTNPPFILDQLDDVAWALSHPNCYAFLHIPVQSGSDAVLLAMNREYTRADFEAVCDHLLVHVPGITLATDIICGFPGETEGDFEATLELVRKYAFGILNISQFYPRPGTPAASMRRLPTALVKARSRRLTTMTEAFDPYRSLVGTTQTIHVDLERERVRDANATPRLVAHTKTFVKVLIAPDEAAGVVANATVEARIVAAHRWHCDAELLTVPNRPAKFRRRPSWGCGQAAVGVGVAILSWWWLAAGPL